MAQSTSGGIYGSVTPGTVIVITNNSGLTRTVTADSTGHFNFAQLPIGDYVIEAKGLGSRNVTVTVGGNANISFANNLETVTITSTKKLIDTTATDTRTVLTAKELSRLPLSQSAQAIALLAPGANAGAAGYFGDLVSFGGAGVSENAYYMNGYFSGEPLSNLGQLELPYGAIAQQETYTGGYSAKYGRSDGGVINQVGKSGTNKFEFGGQITITPQSLRAKPKDKYYTNIPLTGKYVYEDPDKPGTLYQRSSQNTDGTEKYSIYAGGPLIKDKLFAFAALETSERKQNVSPVDGTAYSTHYTTKDPKAYLKLNWNINDDHLLEYTYVGEKYDYSGKRYAYDFDSGTESSQLSTTPDPQQRDSSYNILKYTGYLTDDVTLSAVYGRSSYHNKQVNSTIIPGVPYISSASSQNPKLNGGTTIPNRQGGYISKDGRDSSDGLRADLEWRINQAHTLSAGIDNIKFKATNEGQDQPVDRWIYGRLGNSGNINEALGVGNPYSTTNPDGYYVYKYIYKTATSMSLDQKAYYLEDRWNVVKNVQLTLGLRNDRFTNKNNVGETYMDAKNQWAPRIGAAWDVNGDSSLKAFGNAGRYFLAMPNSVAIRGASASTFTREYFTYTGIDANGAPTGLTAVPGVNGAAAPGPVSANGEYGNPVDVKSFAPSDLKNMYQDEFILGLEKALTKGWTVGAKYTHRVLKSAIDDFCDSGTLAQAAGMTDTNTSSEGKEIYKTADGKQYYVSGCYMFNPGGSNTYSFASVDGSGRYQAKVSAAELGFTEGLKRNYNAIDLFIERAFDNVWSLRVDYTYSKLKGNTEGQVKSNIGQEDISKTQDWDAAALMQYANGYLSNDRRHQLKVRGSYRFAPEWTVTGNSSVLSGAPVTCTGYYSANGVDESSAAGDPVGYESAYHTCFGSVSKPGSIRTPWTYKLDLGLQYRPSRFQDKLAVTVNVFNVTNQRKATQYYSESESAPYTVSNTYMVPISSQTPRYWQFAVSYDY